MTRPRITLLGKPGCHLCDDARGEVARIAADLGVGWEERNILDDPELRVRWADYVPVVMVDDRVLGWFRVDEAELRAALS